MKYCYLGLMVVTLALSSATQADSSALHPLADSVKAARAHSIDVDRLAAIRAVAGSLMNAKQREAEQDPRNGLGAQLDGFRKQLLSQRLAHLNEPLKMADEGIEPSAIAAAREAKASDNLITMLAGLHGKRVALEPRAAEHSGLADAVRKLHELETEIGDIAALPPEERAARIGDLSMRLTPRRVSEFASDLPPQPTLTIGAPLRPRE